ncbi:MAG: hypothetical protein H6744_15055 [Deltaproteobacteria bacterium]|nr:hypothetical protein [Deltaproteobacteria bacterium]MCB9787999.1 hypothetical protein [Deltaproteobacteria bacterium]
MSIRTVCLVLAFAGLVACDNSSGNTIFVLPDTIGDTTTPDSVSDATTPDTTPPNPDSKLVAVLRDPSGAEVTAVDEIHHFGVPPAGSPCPTPLGTLSVTNDSTVDATVTVSTRDIVAIDFKPQGAVTVAPGETKVIDIEFSCASTDDISTVMDVTITNGTESNNFSTTLKLDVQGAP